MIAKFRIWSNDLKEMYVQSDLVITLSHSGINIIHFDSFYEFKDFELMQSTGMTDKNGKEIYEGDIVRNAYGEVGYIKHSVYTFVFAKKKDGEIREFYLHGIGAGSPFEVIGNIHEHPHLLGE